MTAGNGRPPDPGSGLRFEGDDLLRLLETTLETLPLGVTITDLAGKIVYANQAEARMHGFTPEELVGKDARVFSPNKHWKPMSKEQIDGMRRWRRESVNVSADGRLLPVVLTSNLVRNAAGEPLAIISICEEIAGRRDTEEALRRSEERFDVVAQVVSEGLWEWTFSTDLMEFSPRLLEMLGGAPAPSTETTTSWWDRVHPEDVEVLRHALDEAIEGLSPLVNVEHRLAHADGGWRWFLCRGLPVRDTRGAAYRVVGAMTDITERKSAEERLMRDAFYDVLTGLPNRSLLLERLQRSLNRQKRRAGYQFGVLLLDLDRFRNVVGSLGPAVSDRLLTAIARRLERCVRPGDTFARPGGDEFAMLLDDITGHADALKVAERVQKELSQSFSIDGQEVFLSASVGVAMGSEAYERPEDVLRDADTAMYRAKARGRARHEVFHESMRIRAVDRFNLETHLRRALEREELRLHYQPIVSLATGRIIGIEALVRWQHPVRGIVPPDEFIPVAEDTGLIVPIGDWVLRTACRELLEMQGALPAGHPLLAMSVNLSARQFTEPALTARIRAALDDSGVAGRQLKLEITETVLMENAESAAGMLRDLRALDVQLHIDDFGTGYSSLSYLQRFPIDSLKIDKSFVWRMEQEENLEIVKTIVSLAHGLSMEVLAEGIETPAQLAHLRTMGCDAGQGHFFARPLTRDQVTELVSSSPAW
ncbi:MAG: EAL domain-containing protein [Acidobacteria bacterium]|nr:EAL domain-containing protein [Acidobacteriota bacterium]